MPTTDLARALWRKSSRSGTQGNCVEVGVTDTAVGVRDTKDRDGGTLGVARDEWRVFIDGVKSGQFDL